MYLLFVLCFLQVDQKISKLANMLDTNFQTVTIQHVGFSKHLYFNPGYYDDGGGGGDGKSLRLSISKDGQDEGQFSVSLSLSKFLSTCALFTFYTFYSLT